MKAKVKETGEIVEVHLYSDPYYKEEGQAYDRRGWYEDELEFELGPKMVSIDKICKWLKENMENDNDGHGYPKITISNYSFVEDFIEECKKAMDE